MDSRRALNVNITISSALPSSNMGMAQPPTYERQYLNTFHFCSFQARIGNMDGVFVAYHNTARLFGFQYVPLQEMDERLFGTRPGAGERVFRKCVGLMEVVAGEITECYPEQVCRMIRTLQPTFLMLSCFLSIVSEMHH